MEKEEIEKIIEDKIYELEREISYKYTENHNMKNAAKVEVLNELLHYIINIAD